jgi:hypothetical protein
VVVVPLVLTVLIQQLSLLLQLVVGAVAVTQHQH